MDDLALLVFARVPVPGEVKTRLAPVLGAEGAAALHRRLLERTLHTARAAGCAPVQLWYAGEPAPGWLAGWTSLPGWSRHAQGPGDLGLRMRQAFESALRGARAAVLVGSDVVSLQAEDLRAAGRALAEGLEAVLAPTADGGYGLIGLRTVHPRLFEGIGWGGPEVARETRARLEELGWRWRELREQWDVDRPEDLARLPPGLLADP